MRDPLEVLRDKETELRHVQEQVEALRIAGELLSDPQTEGVQPNNRGKILQMPKIS